MSADPVPSLREELPAHAAWVRRLAGRLVRDESAAEDLAQETVLAALRARRPIRGALRPWLARVAANLARRGWRDAAVRRGGERAAARTEALPATDEIGSRLEIQERLVEELKRLPEPLRTTLVRRFFDGWPAARIARESGQPASTVRWHLQRGLAELRERLDRRQASDGVRWRPALLACARSSAPLAAAARAHGSNLFGPFYGAMAVKVSAQLVVAGVLLAAAGVGVFLVATKQSSKPRSAPASAEAPPALLPPATLEPRPSAELAEARVPLPTTAPASVERREEPAPAPETRVDGRCVDRDLVPIPGARVQAGDELAASVLTGGDGTFTLACGGAEQSGPFRIDADGYGTRFVSAVIEPEETTHLGDIVLAPGGRVRGRVLQASGAPFAGAEVRVTDTQLLWSLDEARRRGPDLYTPSVSAPSAPDGAFEVNGVTAGMVRVWASAPGMLHAVSAPIEVPVRGETEELVLTLEPLERPDRLTVVVLDPSGEPVPHASLGFKCWNRSGGSTASTKSVDDVGRLQLPAPLGSTFDLSASDPEERWIPVALHGVEPTVGELELRFLDTPWIEVVVRASGEPVTDYSIAACPSESEPELAARSEHPAGRTRVHALAAPFAVVCDAPGYRVARRGPFAADAAPALLEFELQPEPALRGRVLVYGEPVSGARVTLHDADPRNRIDHDGYPSFWLPEALDETRSDAEGRFVLRARARGEFVVRAEAEDLAAADVGPFPFDPSQARSDLELALTQGGAIAGRVLMPAGREAAGVIVAVNRGDAHARTVRSGADGRFRFDGLTPGRWYVARGALEIDAKGGGGTAYEPSGRVEIPFNCTVEDRHTTQCNVDLRGWEPCVLRGELRANGAPAALWTLEVWPAGKSAVVGDLPRTSTDAEGRFRIDIDEPARVRLDFQLPREGTASGSLSLEVELHSGENPWKADLDLGRLEGTIAAGAGEGTLYYESAAGVQPWCRLPFAPDGTGRFALPFVPAGRGVIKRWQGKGAELVSTTLLEVDVPARGMREVHLP